MKIALIGYGKMGHEIERIALERGHEIVCTIDIDEEDKFGSPEFQSADVAIEFTSPKSALMNYRRAFAAGVPVVSGTTGWLEHLEEVKEACSRDGKTFFYASNFSLGVYIFSALNNYLARIMNQFPAYDVHMEETHHIHKLDAPERYGDHAGRRYSGEDRGEKGNGPSTRATHPDELEITAFREGVGAG